MQITINLPLFVILPRKRKANKKYMLNLNVYRNTHFQILNQAKQIFTDNFQREYIAYKYPCFTEPIRLSYRLYTGSNRLCDITNIISVIDKFTQDALVSTGVIPDDNYNHIRCVEMAWGGVDKENPRCELRIESEKMCNGKISRFISASNK